MDDVLIAEVRKNAREVLRVQLREFKGRQFVDVRLFATGADGGLVPTRTGIGLRPELLGPVLDALQAAEAVARAEGLLPADGRRA
jgi:hypothetical protein